MDYRRNALSETILTTIVAMLVLVLVWGLLSENTTNLIPAAATVGLVIIAFSVIRFTLSPDRVRANQTSRTLKLASKTLEHMREGLNQHSSQVVCELLLPETQAKAVAMTDATEYVGFACDVKDAETLVGRKIVTEETLKVLETREVTSFESDSLHESLIWSCSVNVEAEIIAPLVVRDTAVGTIKFYYDAPHLVDKTQLAIAKGLAELLSTQLSLAELDRQAELATRAELKALQSQINPHFLFNTINTIASLIRTNPDNARKLLREFAVFYRQTLENSETLITLEREVQQTLRYLMFEVARFGEERIKVQSDIDPALKSTRVPSFIIQPIVENSINHAMRPLGPLTVSIKVYRDGEDVVIEISDDGVGMDRETLESLAHAGPSESGTGIALRNVKGRLQGYFDSDSSLKVESEVDKGTVTIMRLGGAALIETDETDA